MTGQPEHEAIASGEFTATAVAHSDPVLYAHIVDVFFDVDPESYLDDVLTSTDPEAAAAAYEQIVTGEWDGEL